MLSLSRHDAVAKAWRRRADFKGYDRSKGSKYNSWRAILYTQKGRSVGFPETWKDFAVFQSEVGGDWERGKVVRRVDTRLPHSKTNSIWAAKGEENLGRLKTLVVDGVSKTLVEWCAAYGLNYQGVRQRFFKGKNLTPKEILFGKVKAKRSALDVTEQKRTSRMLGAYRLKDKERGFFNDITIEFLRGKIRDGCFYCGDTVKVGLDRIDNKLGHTTDNVVPCCYACNTARMDNFSFSEMVVLGKTIAEIKRTRHEEN